MYFPYFRGKQFELVAVRESAELLAQSGFVPIIEPVKETLNGLDRALEAICSEKGAAIVIVNPDYGDHAGNGKEISKFLNDGFLENKTINAGILLNANMSVDEAMELYQKHVKHSPVFVHAGFAHAKALAQSLGDDLAETQNVLIEKQCGGKLYWRHFRGSKRNLLRDGFVKRRNADHPESERFSDLHVT